MKSEPLVQTERRDWSFEPVVKDILSLFYIRHGCRHDYFRTLLARKVRDIFFYTCLNLTMNSFHSSDEFLWHHEKDAEKNEDFNWSRDKSLFLTIMTQNMNVLGKQWGSFARYFLNILIQSNPSTRVEISQQYSSHKWYTQAWILHVYIFEDAYMLCYFLKGHCSVLFYVDMAVHTVESSR